MQLADIQVNLGGNLHQSIPMRGVTPAEICVLKIVHGDDGVNNVRPTTMDKRTHKDEKDRLLERYTRHNEDIEKMFPGMDPRLPVTLKDIGIVAKIEVDAPEPEEEDDTPAPQAVTPQKLALIAKACYEANAAQRTAIGEDVPCSYKESPDWVKDSIKDGIMFHLANPDANDEDSHENWRAAREAAGWVYGEVKDEEKKTHPCLVDFADLPEEQQAKDRIFRETVWNHMK